MKREFFNSIGHGPSFAVEGNDGRLEPLARDRGRREASGVFLSKMPVDKVNRIRIAKILAGDLSLDRGRAEIQSWCYNVETFEPLLRSNLMLIRLSSTRSTVDAYLVRRGHRVSSKLNRFVPVGRESKAFLCRL